MIHSKIAIIITAAGSSTRIGGGIKKEYLPYNKGTVLSSCAETFLNACSRDFEITDFIVTCPKGGMAECEKALCGGQGVRIVEGSDTRQKSVYNGLLAVHGNPDIVLIHDGARPFVSEELICTTITATQEFGAAVPGLTPTDTQKEIDENGFIVRHLIRSSLSAVQTPQCFVFSKLLAAHERAALDEREYTDDTEIWGAYCGRVKVVPGEVNNIKITYPSDLEKLKVEGTK
jgi:2-C-methyl-D-erythritol 4-phosphate cytidylyltransferase/2-C-methyl-D-erythritol 4-phosphate cytidylyltransferase/2-C-methyl-D-erythritol 2,4-cyclodiphosphate synthase